MSEDAHTELNHAQQEEALGGLYLFLARVFSCPPDEDLCLARDVLLALTSPSDPGGDPLPFGADREEVENGVALLAAALGDNLSLRAVKEDYQRLFLGPGRLLAPPWESVYRSPERLVFQEQTIQVRRAYLSAGFSHQGMLLEPDDHIALELEFLGLLCRQRAKALRAGELGCAQGLLSHRANFLKEHLCAWVQPFAQDIERQASTPFWKAVALLLRAIAKDDYKRTSSFQGRA